MGLARSKEHTVGHDNGRAATRLEQPEKERQKQQLRLFCLYYLQQVLGGVFVVERPCKGRIGQHQGVFLRLASVVLRERIAIHDVWLLDAVQEHVHAAAAQHGGIEIESVEETGMKMLPLLAIVEEVGVMTPQ